MSPPVEALPKAREAAARALAVNDLDAEALAAIAARRACSSGIGPPLKRCS